jgi:hypothetical protein
LFAGGKLSAVDAEHAIYPVMLSRPVLPLDKRTHSASGAYVTRSSDSAAWAAEGPRWELTRYSADKWVQITLVAYVARDDGSLREHSLFRWLRIEAEAQE